MADDWQRVRADVADYLASQIDCFRQMPTHMQERLIDSCIKSEQARARRKRSAELLSEDVAVDRT
jgi:hypothetical protein